MSDHERGPYTPPSDRPLSFDPRRPVRGAGPAPMTLIISGLILVCLIGAVAFIYRGGVRHADQPPAPVGEPLTDIKTPAPPQAGGNDVAAGLTIYKTDNSSAAANTAGPIFAPPPEQPLPVTPIAAAPASPAAAPPPPAPPVKPAAKPAPATTLASLEDSAVAAKAGAKPAAKPGAAPAAPPAGAGWVQIGALSSPALADDAWTDIARLAPGAMAGKGKRVEPISRDGETLYRTYITGFPSHAAAEAFCGRLQAAGKSCLVK